MQVVDRRAPGTGRVLWVTEEPPDRNLGGGSIRQSYLFEAVANTYPTDLLLAGGRPDDAVAASAASVTVVPARRPFSTDHPTARRALALGIAVASRHPSALYAAREVRHDLAVVLSDRARQYELVCVEHGALAPLIPPAHSGRWIITMHNLLSGMLASELELAPGGRQRWFRDRDLRKAVALERRALTRFDGCIVCSQEDADALSAIGGATAHAAISVVPNGVDLGAFEPTPVPAAPHVLLPGRLAWQPNVDGAVWLCSQVWPRVREEVPDARLAIVGQSPLPEVRELARLPGVSVHADVSSMIPYFRATRVVVVPVRVGTGTRLKALEGMAAARPVVGTSVGLAGIGAVDAVHARVADDPKGFAAAVVETLQNDELAARLAAAGRSHVENHFGWDRIRAQFVRTVSELVDEEPTPPARAPQRV
jgi:glycosyltransferase involved in cell wall biosynthesis